MPFQTRVNEMTTPALLFPKRQASQGGMQLTKSVNCIQIWICLTTLSFLYTLSHNFHIHAVSFFLLCYYANISHHGILYIALI